MPASDTSSTQVCNLNTTHSQKIGKRCPTRLWTKVGKSGNNSVGRYRNTIVVSWYQLLTLLASQTWLYFLIPRSIAILTTILLVVRCIFHLYNLVPSATNTFNLLIYAEGAVIVKVDIKGSEQQLGGSVQWPNPHAVLTLPVVHDTIEYCDAFSRYVSWHHSVIITLYSGQYNYGYF